MSHSAGSSEDGDATDATVPCFEILVGRLAPVHHVILGERQRLGEGSLRQLRERAPLVGDELEAVVTQRGELGREGAATVESDEDPLLGAERGAQQHRGLRHQRGQRRMLRRVDPEDWAAVLVVHVEVGDARTCAPVLHPPAPANDVVARVRPHMVVEVEDDRALGVLRGLRCPQVGAGRRQGDMRGPMLGREDAQHAPDPAGRRGRRGAQQLRGRGRLQPANALDAALPDSQGVTAGLGGSHYQRDRRYPGTHPLISRRFFALPAGARGRAWSRRSPTAALRSARSSPVREASGSGFRGARCGSLSRGRSAPRAP
jgi:hypothetical protein